MNHRTTFERLMQVTVNMALATSVSDRPNVRVVNFCYTPETPGIVYFSTCRGNPKVAEFTANSLVAFTTIPVDGVAHVRAQDARVQRSTMPTGVLKALFMAQIPDFSETFEQIGPELDFFEIRMTTATLTLGYDQRETLTF